MISLPGYTITTILYQSRKTAVYRGQRDRDQQPVIIKVLQEEYPTIEELTRLRQEYTIPQQINSTGIVKSYHLETYQNSFALIVEDFGGQSLADFLQGDSLDLNQFLPLAISLADTLIHLHKIPIIHKDIKPNNIIINPNTGEVKLTDFSIAIALPREQQTIINPDLLEGTLAYMSPEQTGRMNRTLDYRTDFYSLGVTFYELLTGQLPFETDDPLELVYCHIARKPLPPHELVAIQGRTTLPAIVSNIVMKLLEKNAEDRYQSAAGLKFDLETCWQQLKATGTLTEFPLGSRDRAPQLLIPQKLYGREAEVTTLLAAFNRIAGTHLHEEDSPALENPQSSMEVILVSGYSGIGKTSIVNEIHKPIVAARGYFISGKFDQFKRNIPYAALIQAFSGLIRQLLTETPEKIALWKTKLLENLGTNGKILIEVIPELELIIGPQPEVPAVGAIEAQNRFNRIFGQFVQVFCQPEHPLAIFLDDLQWADSASLHLIHLLTTETNSQYLLIIGAYRDNEVTPTHPLCQTLEKIRETSAIINEIIVQPLSLVNVHQLIADTLNANLHSSKLRHFSELIFNKTQGNPFFLTQLLKTLYSERLLSYQVETDHWQWDIEEIQAIGITDYNVVELIARNIKKLPEPTQKVLKLAACIGNQFSLEILSIVNEDSLNSTANHLWLALQSGLILPLSEAYKIPLIFAQEELAAVRDVTVNYRFLHDRVQQAAYSLIPDSQKKETHLKIGKLLLQKTNEQQRQENIFALVSQLNFGKALLTNLSEKYELAKLNLAAGKRAKSATAYEAAVSYLNIALELLEPNHWETQYEISLELYFQISESEYLNTNLERAVNLCQIGIEQAKIILEKIKFYTLQIQLNLAQGQIKPALDIGLNTLESLGVSLVEVPPAEFNVEALANLPRMTDLYKLAAMKILLHIYAPAAYTEGHIARHIIYTMLALSSQYGNALPSILAYSNYGAIASWMIPDIDLAYQLGQLSLKILDQLNAKEFQSKTYLNYAILIQHWKEHTRKTLDTLLKSLQTGLEFGDIQFACHAADFYCAHLFFMAEHLDFVTQKISQYLEFIEKLKQQYQLDLLKIIAQLVENFTKNKEDNTTLVGPFFNEAEKIPYFLSIQHTIYLFYIYTFKLMLSLVFRKSDQALENANFALQHLGNFRDIILFTEFTFYQSLALLSQPQNNIENPEESLQQIHQNQEKMKYWAHHAPMNYQHKSDLITAEKARLLGQTMEAMEYYDRAIAGAKENGYIQHEALANELAGEFYLSLGREKIARTYLIDAYYAYARWGSSAKVKDLESRYPEFFASLLNKEKNTSTKQTSGEITRGTLTSSILKISEALDLATVIKASQAISGKVHLEQLLSTLMQVVLENTGAEKFYLLLPKLGQWIIAAQCSDGNYTLPSILLSESQDLPTSIINYVERTKTSLVIDNAKTETTFATDPYIVKHQPKSILSSPVVHQGKLIGILYLENNLSISAFTPERLEVLKILSAQAAISIENAQLYQTLEDKVQERTAQLAEANHQLAQANQEISTLNERLKAENLRLSAELEVTKKLQQMILPKAEELNLIQELDIAGFMQPADEVGGDYYDVLQNNGKVTLSIGDVTGHGLESGVVMLMAQTAVRTLQQSNPMNPVQFFDTLNRTLYQNLQRINPDKNLTLALLEYANGKLQVSGQHEEIIVVRTSGQVERIDTIYLGFPLGLEEDIADFVAQEQVQLNVGDVIVLYTDGITEAFDINSVQYGIERLCQVVSDYRDRSADDIRQAVIEDVRRHIGQQKVFDDITLVVIKRK